MSVKKEEREGLGSSALFGLEVQSAAPVKDAVALFPTTYLTLSSTLRGIIPPQFGHLSSPRPRLTDFFVVV